VSDLSHTDVYTLPTLVDLLQHRADVQGQQAAYTFLGDGERDTVTWTYADLDRQARAIGATLQAYQSTNQRVVLLYPPGLDYIAAFFGCLYAGAIAVPAYPPQSARLDRANARRLLAIVSDAQPHIILTLASIGNAIEQMVSQIPSVAAIRWIATDRLEADAQQAWQMPAIHSQTIVFLQYTSGSTAAPKGVMVSHQNLLHNERMIQQAFGHDMATCVVGWLPLYHDMGLIGNVLQPLALGGQAILMSPVAFLQRPLRWLQAISQYRATTSGGPNFAYDLCVRKITPEQRENLDLSTWSLAFNGAEPIRPATLQRFSETFAACGFQPEAFYPCYGMAEATLFVTGGAKHKVPIVQAFDGVALEHYQVVPAAAAAPGLRALVGCGHLWDSQAIRIVDPATAMACPPEQVGEIWLKGPSVAQGYWGRPVETAVTFQAQLADTNEGPFLRTGDLGFLCEGELFITGRLKDMIIANGRNYYPQDIELVVEQCHSALRPGGAAAFALDIQGEERVVVVAEVDRTYRHTEREADSSDSQRGGEMLIRTIRQAVSEEHELRVHAVVLIKPGTLPKTSSGKVQRHACRVAFQEETLVAWL